MIVGGQARTRAGFTLLELLIAVALLALLMTILFGGLRLGTHQLERRSARLERSSRVALVQNFLRGQLGDARPLTVAASSDDAIVFDGRPDEVEFVGVAPESAVRGGLQLFAVGFARQDGGGGELLLRARFYRGAADGFKRTVLLDHVESATFAYFGSTAPDEPPRWHATWHDIAYLPTLVRLSVTFSDGGRMPDLVVAPRDAPDPARSGPPA
jgi:general secretion pathway protein J